MSASQLNNVLTTLVTVLAADANLTAAGVTVIDGPAVGIQTAADYIVVGASASDESTLSGTTTQEWRSDGGASAFRDETVSLPVTVVSRSGDTDMPTRRARCALLAGYVEAAIRANYTLGLTQIAWVEVVGHTLHQAQTTDGAIAYLELTVNARAVI